MQKFYLEALNTFVMQLTLNCVPNRGGNPNDVSRSLLAAYNDPEASGIDFQSVSDLVAFKWAIVCIALEIKKTAQHDLVLQEVGVFSANASLRNEVRGEIGLDTLFEAFAIDSMGLLQSTLVPTDVRNEVLQELLQDQLYADFIMWSLLSWKSLREIYSPGIFSNLSEDFAVKVLHADIDTFKSPIDGIVGDIESIDILRTQRLKPAIEFLAGRGDSSQFCYNMGPRHRVKANEQLDIVTKVSRDALLSQKWSEGLLLTEFTQVDNNKGRVLAVEIATLASIFIGPGTCDTAFRHGSTIEFIQKLPAEERKGYVISLVKKHQYFRNAESKLLPDFTVEHIKEMPWLMPAVAEGERAGLYIRMIQDLAKTPERYGGDAVPACNLQVQPEQQHRAFSSLLDIIAANSPSKYSELQHYINYAFSFLKCYSLVMGGTEPSINTAKSFLDSETVLPAYIASVDRFVSTVTDMITTETFQDYDYQTFEKMLLEIEGGGESSNIRTYLSGQVARHANGLNLCHILDNGEVQPDAIASPTMTY